MNLRIANYTRRGFTMSRRAYISHKKNEHPITYWIKELAIDKKKIKEMLTCIGVHHTGLYAQRTKFYRLPKLHKEWEFEKFYKAFHSLPATKKKCINFLANHLQENVIIIPKKKFEKKYVSLKEIFAEIND